MCICVTHEVVGINLVTTSTLHILHRLHFMLLAYITKQMGLHIANVGHTVLILYLIMYPAWCMNVPKHN